jgi:radical SAM protein with 4Fe4S-binding SPASM domain
MLDDPLFVFSSPLTIKWEITRGCNLKCKHCYARAGKTLKNELNTEEIKKLLDRLDEIGTISLHFTGGEPFVRKDFLDILEHANRHNFSITILTNATLIDRDLANKLSRINIHSVQVSLDGAKSETHDKIRGIAGAFDLTIRGIKNLIENEIKVSIATTFSKNNINEVEEIYELTKKLGASSFLFGFVFPVGRGKDNFKSLCLSWEEMRKIQKVLVNKARKNKDFPVYIDEAIGMLDKSKWRPPICKAGRIMIAITAEGNIVLCPMLPNVVLGNVRKDDILEIWKNSPMLNYIRNIKNIKGYCSKCPNLPNCGGGCKAMSYMYNNDPMSSDPFCPLRLFNY